jgi:hypothetical protein
MFSVERSAKNARREVDGKGGLEQADAKRENEGVGVQRWQKGFIRRIRGNDGESS